MAHTRHLEVSPKFTVIKDRRRITKNTILSKASHKRSITLLIRVFEGSAAVYGLDITNAIRLFTSLGGRSRSQSYRAYSEPCDAELTSYPNDDLSDVDSQQKSSPPDRGYNGCYNGGAKDRLFYSEDENELSGLSDGASDGIEGDQEDNKTEGRENVAEDEADDSGGKADGSSAYQPLILSTITERCPTTRLENGRSEERRVGKECPV